MKGSRSSRFSQQAVHEEAGEDGVDDAEEIADHGREQHKGHRRAGAAQASARELQGALGLPAGHEVLSGPDVEHDAGKGAVKLLHCDLDLTAGGVVETGVVPPETVEHDEVVEIPVDDAGEGHFLAHAVELAAVALRLEAVAARRDQHVFRVGAVAGDAAVETDLLQRHPFAVVGHHHGKAGGAAFERLHLHDDGDPGTAMGHRLPDPFLPHVILLSGRAG